jgi:hypothetical protein
MSVYPAEADIESAGIYEYTLLARCDRLLAPVLDVTPGIFEEEQAESDRRGGTLALAPPASSSQEFEERARSEQVRAARLAFGFRSDDHAQDHDASKSAARSTDRPLADFCNTIP